MTARDSTKEVVIASSKPVARLNQDNGTNKDSTNYAVQPTHVEVSAPQVAQEVPSEMQSKSRDPAMNAGQEEYRQRPGKQTSILLLVPSYPASEANGDAHLQLNTPRSSWPPRSLHHLCLRLDIRCRRPFNRLIVRWALWQTGTCLMGPGLPCRTDFPICIKLMQATVAFTLGPFTIPRAPRRRPRTLEVSHHHPVCRCRMDGLTP